MSTERKALLRSKPSTDISTSRIWYCGKLSVEVTDKAVIPNSNEGVDAVGAQAFKEVLVCDFPNEHVVPNVGVGSERTEDVFDFVFVVVPVDNYFLVAGIDVVQFVLILGSDGAYEVDFLGGRAVDDIDEAGGGVVVVGFSEVMVEKEWWMA